MAALYFDHNVDRRWKPSLEQAGHSVVLTREVHLERADDALQLPNLPARQEVTLLNTVPSAIAELLRMGGVPDSVRTVNLAGEPLSTKLVQQLRRLF